MKNLCKVMREYGLTIEEACEAVSRMPKIPFTKMDIVLIQRNPNLSLFQKLKLIREIKKEIIQE